MAGCGAPIGLVTLATGDERRVIAPGGVPPPAVHRLVPLCDVVLASADAVTLLPEAALLAAGGGTVADDAPPVRFGAGASIRTADGAIAGALLIGDVAPRARLLGPGEQALLGALARQVARSLGLGAALAEARTARLQAEADARAAAEEASKQALLANHTRSPAVITDAAGCIEWVNEAFTAHTGYTLAEVKGRVPGQVLQGPATDPGVAEALRERIRAGQAFQGELLGYRKDGTPYWTLLEVQPIRDATGAVINFVSTEADITARKEMERALEEREERYRLASMATNDVIWDWNLATGRVSWSRAIADVLGHTDAPEITDAAWWVDRLHPEDAAAVTRSLDEAVARGDRAWSMEYRFRKGDGTWAHVLDRAHGVADPSGRPVRMVGAMFDLTVQHRAREFLRTVIDLNPSLIFAKDREGRFTLANRATAECYGTTVEELLGRSDLDYNRDVAQVRRYLEDDRRVLDGGQEVFVPEETITDARGRRRILQTTKRPVLGEDGEQQLFGVATDITALKESQAELREARDAAEAASRAKSQFLANTSHELRTPLNGVIGMASLLLGTTLTAEQRRFVEVIQSSATLLLGIINDVLDLSKIEAGCLELAEGRVELGPTVRTAVDLLRARAEGKGLRLSCLIDEDLPRWVVVDANRVCQVLINLVGNAIKFTDRGQVEVRGELLRREPGRAWLRFVVSDTGIGIPPEKIGRLFKPFSQVDESATRRFSGTGLGLAISKQLVALLGGEIAVDSAAGVGSRFSFEVPVRPDDGDLAAPALIAPARATPGRWPWPARILVAEDNPVNTLVIREILAALGLGCDEAKDGREAVAAVSKGRYDLVFMDCQMPELDGYAAARAIREQEARRATDGAPGRRVAIVALTASAFTEDRERCLAHGMDGFVAKPINKEKVRDALTTFLGEAPAA